MRAYWFSDGDKLQYRDKRVPQVGVTHTHRGRVRLCKEGLHASLDPLDALQFAPGNTLWLVECGGDVIYGDDKLVCSERTYLARIDATELLQDFARWCALQVIDLWEAPAVVRQYLTTGDESLRSEAYDAANAAAYAAADASYAAAAAAAVYAAVYAAAAYAADYATAATYAANYAYTIAREAHDARDARDEAVAVQRMEFQRRVDAVFAAQGG